jgi:translation initiation factor RLI1
MPVFCSSWLAGWAVLALVGWLACGFVGWDHLQASKFKEAQNIQQVDELHQAIKGQKVNDAVAALEAKYAVDSVCTIPKANKSLKKQISNDSEGYPVLRSAATQLT